MSDPASSSQPAAHDPASRVTVLVIGAGASKEAGLPVGSELRQMIADALDFRPSTPGGPLDRGDRVIWEAIGIEAGKRGARSRELPAWQHTAWDIRNAMPFAISIDNFLDSHRGDAQIELCGKLAITRTILQAERGSALWLDPTKGAAPLKINQLASTWFGGFFQLLTENCHVNDLEARFEQLAIVNFNYDRCVEHFILHALAQYYRLPLERAAGLLCRLRIFHPYGVVGTLPWRQPGTTSEFGAEPTAPALIELSKSIRTFTEGVAPGSEVTEIRATVASAERLVFLGFAFHPLNVDLILPPRKERELPSGGRLYATAHGISESDARVIASDLTRRTRWSDRGIWVRHGLTCADLFHEYRRSLGFPPPRRKLA